MYRTWCKPLLDRSAAALGLLLASPLLVLILVAYATAGQFANAFFTQQRPGRNGRPFTLLKFKTMNDARDATGALLPDAQRLTALGKFLRHTSLDELPQLINVLKGEMSLVGPRPLLMEYLPRYTPRQARRHEVLPGITGWAQVNGRNLLSWDEKFELDLYYVEHCSLLLDLKILMQTVLHAVRGTGISSKSSATMEEFKGTL